MKPRPWGDVKRSANYPSVLTELGRGGAETRRPLWLGIRTERRFSGRRDTRKFVWRDPGSGVRGPPALSCLSAVARSAKVEVDGSEQARRRVAGDAEGHRSALP